MPEEPSRILRDADFTVCYDSAHMRSLGGGWSEDSTRSLKSGVSDLGCLFAFLRASSFELRPGCIALAA